jgi:thiol-disulfide isomerase/thioredoxin
MNIITYLFEKTRRHHFTIVVTLLVLFFSLVGYYAYTRYFKSKENMTSNDFNDVANMGDNTNIAQIYFFHAQWCPHCKKAYPEWTSFATSTNRQVINGYLVECIEVDCTEDNGAVDHTIVGINPTPVQKAELIHKFNINSYPTIKLVKDDETIDFDAKITQSSLNQFITNVLA